ncbi:lanthionine synthetase LanC family protein [Amycolatopsis magusensis]|uniref:lanthionine synthetase LanC family protein n=1 Tax=Amycolatopsis magusensis TaxID=882444 RepID=UPI00379F2C30
MAEFDTIRGLAGLCACLPRQDPSSAALFPGGHGNFGLAHGISGPLALLAHAPRRGIAVDDHEAVGTICAWLDSWRLDTPGGHRWPYMIPGTRRGQGPNKIV